MAEPQHELWPRQARVRSKVFSNICSRATATWASSHRAQVRQTLPGKGRWERARFQQTKEKDLV